MQITAGGVSLDCTGINKLPISAPPAAVNIMIVALRFDLFMAAQGIELEEEYFIESSSVESDRCDH